MNYCKDDDDTEASSSFKMLWLVLTGFSKRDHMTPKLTHSSAALGGKLVKLITPILSEETSQLHFQSASNSKRTEKNFNELLLICYFKQIKENSIWNCINNGASSSLAQKKKALIFTLFQENYSILFQFRIYTCGFKCL